MKDHTPNTDRVTTMFKQYVKSTKSFTSVNTHRDQIWQEVFHMHNISQPLSPKIYVMGPKPTRWCKFHKVNGLHMKDCHKIKKEIEHLI